VNLYARPGGLGQTPFATTAPVAIISVHCSNRRAHRGHLANARLERPSARHVDRDRQIHQRDRRQHHRHLADADRAANAAILRRYHQVFYRNWLRHPAIGSIAHQLIVYVHLFILYIGKRVTGVR